MTSEVQSGENANLKLAYTCAITIYIHLDVFRFCEYFFLHVSYMDVIIIINIVIYQLLPPVKYHVETTSVSGNMLSSLSVGQIQMRFMDIFFTARGVMKLELVMICLEHDNNYRIMMKLGIYR